MRQVAPSTNAVRPRYDAGLTITVPISEGTEAALKKSTAERGLDVGAIVGSILEDRFGTPASTPPREPTLDDVLRPFREGFDRSGLSDDELTALFEEARDEVWNEQHPKPTPP